jgi:hypothetical protein
MKENTALVALLDEMGVLEGRDSGGERLSRAISLS